MFKSRVRGKSHYVEHLGEKTIEKAMSSRDVLKLADKVPFWRERDLLVINQGTGYKVQGWIDEVNPDKPEITYITIPLKLQKNCRAFLKGGPIGLVGKIQFDEKKIDIKHSY